MRLLVCLFFYLYSSISLGETLVGNVIGINDGDSITIIDSNKNQTKIRLEQIDSPELSQPYGKKSKQKLSDLIFGKSVTVEVTSKDRYGRSLGRVYLDDTDINVEMLKTGMTWVYRQYSKDKSLLKYEDEARIKKVGLWSLPEPERIPPWEWRRGKRNVPISNDVKKHAEPSLIKTPDVTYTCDMKTKCIDMTSCSEAMFYLNSCGLYRLDGDNDGVPCESICK